MDTIYFTNKLLNFSTKIFPEKSIIINLLKYNKHNYIPEIINKLNIKNILCENNTTKKYIQKILPNKTIKLIEQEKITKYYYNDKNIDYHIYFLLLSGITTFFILSIPSWKNSFLIATVIFIFAINWMICYYFLVRNQPWEHLSIDS